MTSTFASTERFQLLRKLGAGGMGVVYEVLDQDTGQKLALKTLPAAKLANLLRFKNEFRALQDIAHPHLIRLGELLEHDGTWFFTMELIQGCDFLLFIRSSNTPPEDDSQATVFHSPDAPTQTPVGDANTDSANISDPTLVDALSPDLAIITRPPDFAKAPSNSDTFSESRLREALYQLAQGLCALHDANRIHRDLKPSNVMVTDQGRVVILDFGLIKDLQNDSIVPGEKFHVMGTAVYMAPEQALQYDISPAADWYSVGVMLYEALTGQLPFSGPAMQVLMLKQLQDPIHPSQLRQNLPPDLESLCVRLLSRDPAQRPTGPEILHILKPHAHPKSSTSLTSAPKLSADLFIGRSQELDFLENAWKIKLKGKSSAVLIQAASGLGKSALVRHWIALKTGEESRLVVLWGRCYERESIPYKAFDGVMDSLSRFIKRLSQTDLADLLPENAGLIAQAFPVLQEIKYLQELVHKLPDTGYLDPHEKRSRLFAALRELFQILSVRYPLVIALDDLQWVDVDSMALFTDLLRQPDAPPIFWLATRRPPTLQLTEAQEKWAIPTVVQILPLEPLAPEETQDLTRTLLRESGVLDEMKVQTLAQESGGHPLFLDALVRHLSIHGSQEKIPDLDAILWQQMQELAPDAQQILACVVVAGVPVTLNVIHHATFIEAYRFDEILAQLRVGHLIRTTGPKRTDRVESYHDRIREVFWHHLTETERQAYHLALAQAVELQKLPDSEMDPETLASHWLGAGHVDRAKPPLQRAAQAAEQALAFDHASKIYQMLLDTESDPAEHRTIQKLLAESLANAGRGAEAAEHFLILADFSDGLVARGFHRRAAEQLLVVGHFKKGLKVARKLLEEINFRWPETQHDAIQYYIKLRTKLSTQSLQFAIKNPETTKKEKEDVELYYQLGLSILWSYPIVGASMISKSLFKALKTGDPLLIIKPFIQESIQAAIESNFVLSRQLIEYAKSIKQSSNLNSEIDVINCYISYGETCLAFWEERIIDYLKMMPNTLELLYKYCPSDGNQIAGMQFGNWGFQFWLGEFHFLRREMSRRLHEANKCKNIVNQSFYKSETFAVYLAGDDPQSAMEESNFILNHWPPFSNYLLLSHIWQWRSECNSLLYLDRANIAYQKTLAIWENLETFTFRVNYERVIISEFRARCALNLAKKNKNKERIAYLNDVQAMIERIAILKRPTSFVLAPLLRAGVAKLLGQVDEAKAYLRTTIEKALEHDMHLHEYVARWRLAELTDGEEGARQLAEARQWFVDREVVNPTKFVNWLAPVG